MRGISKGIRASVAGRLAALVAAWLAVFVPIGILPAFAAAPTAAYQQAETGFENGLTDEDRIEIQILLISGGYATTAPTAHFTPAILKAIEAFQADNGFTADGNLNQKQITRLLAEGTARLRTWGFQKVNFPGRPVAIWVPIGLGLTGTVTKRGLRYLDPKGRLELDFTSASDALVKGVYDDTLATATREKATIHENTYDAAQKWFVLSTTTPDGHDHYARYHQDGTAVTGFALEWNNAAGDIKGGRIAILMSSSLAAVFLGTPFHDPPDPAEVARIDETPKGKPSERPATNGMWSTGTGFFVTSDGHLVTNNHVIEGCTHITVKTPDGSTNRTDVVATDKANDLALLKVQAAPTQVASLRVSPRLGEAIEAFGFPHTDILSKAGNFTLGDIAALNGMGDDTRYLQISAPVQAGNSGGPLLDRSGNVLGVVSSKLDAIKVMLADGDLMQNVNFAIKASLVVALLQANKIAYRTGTLAADGLKPADIAAQAQAMSGFVVCR